MKCEEIKNLISHYLEDDLDSVVKQELDAHFSSCNSCASELRQMRQMLSGLKELPEAEPPLNFLQLVRQRLDKPPFLEELLKRIFVPVYIKIPLEAIAVTATVVIVMVLVHKTELVRLTRTGIPPRSVEVRPQALESGQRAAGGEQSINRIGQYEPYTARQFSFDQLHPRDMSSQMANGDFQRMSQAQSSAGEITKSRGIPERREEAILEKGKISDKENAFSYEKEGFALKSASTLAEFKADALKEAVPVFTATQIILKSRDLEQDRIELERILKDLGVTQLKIEPASDNVLFSFLLPAGQMDVLLSELKEWQPVILPAEHKAGEKEAEAAPISIKLTLPTQ